MRQPLHLPFSQRSIYKSFDQVHVFLVEFFDFYEMMEQLFGFELTNSSEFHCFKKSVVVFRALASFWSTSEEGRTFAFRISQFGCKRARPFWSVGFG